MSPFNVAALALVAIILVAVLITGRKLVIGYKDFTIRFNETAEKVHATADTMESVSAAVNHQDNDPPLVELVKQVIVSQRTHTVAINNLQAMGMEGARTDEQLRRAIDSLRHDLVDVTMAVRLHQDEHDRRNKIR